MKYIGEIIIGILIGMAVLFLFAFFGFAVGYSIGEKKGYTDALDDARLGKPARYKLVQTAEKWVEVKR